MLSCCACVRVWAEWEPWWHFVRGFFLSGVSVLRGMGRVYVTFTSYISNGRCTVMENFVPLRLLQGFVCGQAVMIKSSTLNTRGHKAAKNSIQATASLILFSKDSASYSEKGAIISTWRS